MEIDGKRRRVWMLRVTQAKTGARVAVPVHERLLPELLARREAERAPGRTVIAMRPTARSAGAPWRLNTLAVYWRQVMREAGLGALTLQPRDLRRTAVVRLLEAGATVAQAAAITGHSIQRSTEIFETYGPRSAVMAAGGIVRLEAHMRRREGPAPKGRPNKK